MTPKGRAFQAIPIQHLTRGPSAATGAIGDRIACQTRRWSRGLLAAHPPHVANVEYIAHAAPLLRKYRHVNAA